MIERTTRMCRARSHSHSQPLTTFARSSRARQHAGTPAPCPLVNKRLKNPKTLPNSLI